VVGLFVNEGPEVVRAACDALPINILQFHGDEDAAYCRQFSRPWLRAARVRPGLDLVEFAGSFPEARGCCSMPSSKALVVAAMFSTGR
jgi:phosphoribosylanthranilate isomerase